MLSKACSRTVYLAEAHFVGENAVEVIVIQRHEPFEALYLIGFEDASDEKDGLFGHAFSNAMRDGVVRINGRRVILVVFGRLFGFGQDFFDDILVLDDAFLLLLGRRNDDGRFHGSRCFFFFIVAVIAWYSLPTGISLQPLLQQIGRAHV